MKTYTVALAVVSLCFSAAQASEFEGLFMGVKAGLNRSDISGAVTASRKDAISYGLEEGYNFDVNGYLAGVDFFVDLNEKANRNNVQVYSGSNSIGLDLKLGKPLGNLMPYLKLGWDRTTGTGLYPAAQFKYTNHLHNGLGVEYKWTRNWSVAGEWTNSVSNINNSKLTNNNFTIGSNYYFSK